MAEGQLGFVAVVQAALLRPMRLFKAARAGRVGVRPASMYGLGAACTGFAMGLEVARSAQASAVECALLFTAGALLVSPLSWFLDAGVTYALTRALGGPGTWRDAKTTVGLSSAPLLFALIPIPYAWWLFGLWAAVCRGYGLRVLQRIELWRVVIALLATGALFGALDFGRDELWLEASRLPSNSMFPSLQTGDHFYASNSSYGWSKKSQPARGEVVTFQYPSPDADEPATNLVKRVIGLPGDELRLEAGVLSINGWNVPRCALGKASAATDSDQREYEIFVEFLEGRAYLVAQESGSGHGTQGPYRVGAEEFWVVGDNRSNSSDSRSWGRGRGAGVPVQNVRGRVWRLWLPMERFGIDVHGAPILSGRLERLQAALHACLAKAPTRSASTPPGPKQAL